MATPQHYPVTTQNSNSFLLPVASRPCTATGESAPFLSPSADIPGTWTFFVFLKQPKFLQLWALHSFFLCTRWTNALVTLSVSVQMRLLRRNLPCLHFTPTCGLLLPPLGVLRVTTGWLCSFTDLVFTFLHLIARGRHDTEHSSWHIF